MEVEVDKEMIASEYALIKKQIRKKERKLKKMNKALQAKEHVRKTLEVYTKKKSPYKDPKVADAVKFKEGSPEVMNFVETAQEELPLENDPRTRLNVKRKEGSLGDIGLVNSQENIDNNQLKKKFQIEKENNFVAPKAQILPMKKVRINPAPSQDLFAPTLAPAASATIASNVCSDVDSTPVNSVTTVTSVTSLTSETPFNNESESAHLNEDLNTSAVNESDNDDLLNDSFTDFDFQTLPLISESQNTHELCNNDARTENGQSIKSESQELSSDNFVSQNINIVRKGRSRKITPRSSEDSLKSNERNRKVRSKNTGYNNEGIIKFNRDGFLDYRESMINNSLVTNSTCENKVSRDDDDDDYSNSLAAFAVDFDEMQIESSSVNKREQDDEEDEIISLAAEKAESNLKSNNCSSLELDTANGNVYNTLIKDSKLCLSENKKENDNSCKENFEEFNKKIVCDKTLKSIGKKENYEKGIQCYKFPVPESQGEILICSINVHNVKSSKIDNGVKRSIPTALVIQEFGLSIWQCCTKTAKVNKQSKENFHKSWREIGRKDYNFGKTCDILHIVANGLPSVENDVRFYVITKKANEKDGNIIYIQVSSCPQFSKSDVVVTESIIPISSVCKGLYSSVLTEWSIAIYYILQLNQEVSGGTGVGESTGHINKALHMEFDLTYLMRRRCWKLDHQTSPLYNIGNISSMAPLIHKDMNGILLLANSKSQLEIYDVEVDGILKQITCPVDSTKSLHWAAVIKDIILFMISYKNTIEFWAIDSTTNSVEKIFSSNLAIGNNFAGNLKSDNLKINATCYVNKNFFAISNCGSVWCLPTTSL